MRPFTRTQLHVIWWAAQECEWQQSGEMSVVWMLDAWQYAIGQAGKVPTEADVIELGRLVEPRTNANGYRRTGVRVGSSVKGPAELVPRQIQNLVTLGVEALAQPVDTTRGVTVVALDPVEWFRQYEEIHPFRDGNGRTGNILYNWLRGSLHAPVFPPNLWADPRR